MHRTTQTTDHRPQTPQTTHIAHTIHRTPHAHERECVCVHVCVCARKHTLPLSHSLSQILKFPACLPACTPARLSPSMRRRSVTQRARTPTFGSEALRLNQQSLTT